MKKILLSVLMMSLCGSVFAAPEGFDYSVLDKIKIDCSRYKMVDDNTVQFPNGKTIWLPKPNMEEFLAKISFQDTLHDNENAFPKKVIDVMYLFPNHVSDKRNSHCGKSLSQYMEYNKEDLISYVKIFHPESDINKFVIGFYENR